ACFLRSGVAVRVPPKLSEGEDSGKSRSTPTRAFFLEPFGIPEQRLVFLISQELLQLGCLALALAIRPLRFPAVGVASEISSPIFKVAGVLHTGGIRSE